MVLTFLWSLTDPGKRFHGRFDQHTYAWTVTVKGSRLVDANSALLCSRQLTTGDRMCFHVIEVDWSVRFGASCSAIKIRAEVSKDLVGRMERECEP